jgi:hypothetical protein
VFTHFFILRPKIHCAQGEGSNCTTLNAAQASYAYQIWWKKILKTGANVFGE